MLKYLQSERNEDRIDHFLGAANPLQAEKCFHRAADFVKFDLMAIAVLTSLTWHRWRQLKLLLSLVMSKKPPSLYIRHSANHLIQRMQ